MTPQTTPRPEPTFLRTLATILAAVFLSACAEQAPVGPGALAASPASGASLTTTEAAAASDGRTPDLGTCTNLQVPEGSRIAFHAFAIGAQVYRWNGAAWAFVAPDATLYADAAATGLVGTHFAGPTWLTVSGSRVTGAVALNGRCTPDANAIPWLKLDAVESGTGVFEQVRYVQRLNTTGGLAPSVPGSTVGQEARVPYTAEYWFYRAP